MTEDRIGDRAAEIQRRLDELMRPYVGRVASAEVRAAIVTACAQYLETLEDRPESLSVSHMVIGADGVARVQFRCDQAFADEWYAAMARR